MRTFHVFLFCGSLLVAVGLHEFATVYEAHAQREMVSVLRELQASAAEVEKPAAKLAPGRAGTGGPKL